MDISIQSYRGEREKALNFCLVYCRVELVFTQTAHVILLTLLCIIKTSTFSWKLIPSNAELQFGEKLYFCSLELQALVVYPTKNSLYLVVCGFGVGLCVCGWCCGWFCLGFFFLVGFFVCFCLRTFYC